MLYGTKLSCCMLPWCHDTKLLRCHASMLSYCHNTKLPCFHGAMQPSCYDIMLLTCHAAMVLCWQATMLCRQATMLFSYQGAKLPCYHAACHGAMLSCNHVVMMLCWHVALLPFYQAGMLAWCQAATLACGYAAQINTCTSTNFQTNKNTTIFLSIRVLSCCPFGPCSPFGPCFLNKLNPTQLTFQLTKDFFFLSFTLSAMLPCCPISPMEVHLQPHDLGHHDGGLTSLPESRLPPSEHSSTSSTSSTSSLLPPLQPLPHDLVSIL